MWNVSDQRRQWAERLSGFTESHERSARGGALESLERAPDGTSAIPPLDVALRQRATSSREYEDALKGLEKTRSGAELNDSEYFALEAIVEPMYRPVLNVVGDQVHAAPSPWEKLMLPDVRARIQAAIRAVGRVEVPDHPSLPYAGTAFLVGPGLMMTNRHVAQIFARGLGRRDLEFISGLSSVVDFKRELQSPESVRVRVVKVEAIHPYWDCAILRVEGLDPARTPLALEAAEPDRIADREVVVIGYPAQDYRSSDFAMMMRIFGGVFNVKRLQPGLLRGYQIIKSFGNEVSAITHDASTLGGNSGSAVVDVATGRVVGLHFAGQHRIANYAVPAWELARDARVVDLGIDFSARDRPPPAPPWEAKWQEAGG